METDTIYDEEQLYNEVFDTEDVEPSEEFLEVLQSLVDAGFLQTRLYNDRAIYFAREGLKWSDFAHLDNRFRQKILLVFAKNPKTFFVLYNTQKGKMRIAALEIRAWTQERTVKPVAFVMVDNDKTLADQSADGLINMIGTDNIGLLLLSSNSTTKYDEIKTKLDAYAADTEGEYKMPVIVALANKKQTEKVVKLMHHIQHKVTRGSLLRYGVIFDEADKIYPQLRNTRYGETTLRELIVDDERALYKLGFVTATHGDLLDVEEYPECANAHLYETDVGDPNYRALHHPESVIKTVKHSVSTDNNKYALEILTKYSSHFAVPVNGYHRKIIINSNSSAKSMETFAATCVAKNMYAMTFNMNGINVYGQGAATKFSAKGRKFNEVLFQIYKTLKLDNKPLVIIGRRKVDRGLGFHYAPRTGDEGLIWTDIILGRIDDKATAVQKAGRGAGIIAQCPQYIGSVTYWTDERTANTIKRHNQIVDTANAMGTCSAIQAVGHAEERFPDTSPSSQGTTYCTDPFATTDAAQTWIRSQTWNRYTTDDGKHHKYSISEYKLHADKDGQQTIRYAGKPMPVHEWDDIRTTPSKISEGLGTKIRIMPVYVNNAIQYIVIYSEISKA